MSLIECPCCHNETEARQLACCPQCGEYACDECMQSGNGLCPDCACRAGEQSGAQNPGGGGGGGGA